jgi:tetratricopeptide (TPR) repeat protein
VLVGSATAVAVVAVAGFGLWSVRSQDEERFKTLMDRGRRALEYGHPSSNAPAYLQQAVAMRPNNATAQGLLAASLSFAADFGDPRKAAAAVEGAEGAVRAALAIDPDEPNARLAQVTLQRSMLDLATTEDRLRQILATAPENIFAMRVLWGLLQSAGRSHDAFALIERATAIEPLAAGNNFPRAQLLWILGRTAEADRVIDRAMQYWPSHPWVRAARFSIFAYTGRPRAALAMLNDEKTRPQEYTPAGIALWRVSLRALDQQSATNIALARNANVEAARQDRRLAAQALLVLSALGEIDAALDVANDLMLFRPPVAPPAQTGPQHPPVKSTAWLFTPWLFTPPAASLRADSRFKTLCDGIGLTEYWHTRGIGPDAFLFER